LPHPSVGVRDASDACRRPIVFDADEHLPPAAVRKGDERFLNALERVVVCALELGAAVLAEAKAVTEGYEVHEASYTPSPSRREADERDLDSEDLAALRAPICEGRAEIARGEGIPLDEVLAELDMPDAE
jgi:hypothetical protein